MLPDTCHVAKVLRELGAIPTGSGIAIADQLKKFRAVEDWSSLLRQRHGLGDMFRPFIAGLREPVSIRTQLANALADCAGVSVQRAEQLVISASLKGFATSSISQPFHKVNSPNVYCTLTHSQPIGDEKRFTGDKRKPMGDAQNALARGFPLKGGICESAKIKKAAIAAGPYRTLAAHGTDAPQGRNL